MRKHYFKSFLALLCVSALLFCANTSDAARFEQLTVGELTVEQSLSVQGLLQAAANTTGTVYYVNSSGGINSPGAWGETSSQPLATIEYAINRCTASQNDFIIVMPGHTESYTAAAGATNGGFDADVAGITIIGLGNGANRPTLTFADTDATVAIGAANVVVANIRLLAGISDIVIGVAVEAGGDNFTLLECDFPVPGTATFEFLDAIDLESGADGFKCLYNKYRDGATSAANHFIECGNGVNVNLEIIGNDIFGRFAVSAIWSDTIDTGAIIKDNVIANTITGQHCVEFTTTATGVITDNRFATDTEATTIDPGSMYCLENYVTISTDSSASLSPAATGGSLEAVDFGYNLKSVAGSAMPFAFWYVDANIATSGTGTTPSTAFKTITEAITACSNSVDDWILVYDYSGGGGTITINKAFVHLIGNGANGAMNYPRIKPASAVVGIEITAAGDRVEIANFVIGGGDGTVAAIAIDTAAGGGAYGVYIHDNVIGRDSDAPALIGISVPTGGAAPYLKVENNRFIGAAGTGIAAAGSAIKLVGNATRCQILNNKILDVGRTATPAIWLSGSVTEPTIVGNHIKTDTDTGTGSAITLSANVDDGWISDNVACDGKDAPANNPFVDGASTNGWGTNYTGKDVTLP
jgi:hypothetical protein